jgi:hypothetical protein
MNTNNSSTNNLSWIWWGILGLALLSALFKTNDSSTSSSTSGSSYSSSSAPVGVDRNSFEHRYAKERVRLEGYSDREAEQAADAIIKFHNAQQNR